MTEETYCLRCGKECYIDRDCPSHELADKYIECVNNEKDVNLILIDLKYNLQKKVDEAVLQGLFDGKNEQIRDAQRRLAFEKDYDELEMAERTAYVAKMYTLMAKIAWEDTKIE